MDYIVWNMELVIIDREQLIENNKKYNFRIEKSNKVISYEGSNALRQLSRYYLC